MGIFTLFTAGRKWLFPDTDGTVASQIYVDNGLALKEPVINGTGYMLKNGTNITGFNPATNSASAGSSALFTAGGAFNELALKEPVINGVGFVFKSGTTTSFVTGNNTQFVRPDGTVSNFANSTVAVGIATDPGTTGNLTSSTAIGTAIWWLQKKIDNITPITATANLDFPSTAASMSSDLTVTVTGAALGDVVALGSPVPPANSNYTAFVSAADTVTVRYSNFSATPLNPASATFKIKIIK